MSNHVGYVNDFCPVCRCPHHRHFTTTNSWEIVRCEECNFTFSKAVPTDEYLSEYYREKYCAAGGEFVPRTSRGRRWKYKALAMLIKYWQRRRDKIRLLEVGCGQGDLLSTVQHESRFEATGIDLAEGPLGYAQSQGLDVHRSDLESMQLDADSFDMVVALHVMEHVQNPERFIAEIRRVLKPGGHFFAVMPCISHIKARLKGERWHYLGAPAHLWYFAPKTLSRFVERLGLQAVYASTLYHRAHVRILAQKPNSCEELAYETWMGDPGTDSFANGHADSTDHARIPEPLVA